MSSARTGGCAISTRRWFTNAAQSTKAAYYAGRRLSKAATWSIRRATRSSGASGLIPLGRLEDGAERLATLSTTTVHAEILPD